MGDLQGQYADYTPAELVELNQKLLNDSVPERPFIDDVTPMSGLRVEYEKGKESFVHQIDWLTRNGFTSIRRTRGDGNCFYRSLAFAYIESLAVCPDIEFAVASSLSMLESTKEKLKEAGIQELVYEDFYEEFVQLIQRMNENLDIKMKKSLLLAAFQNPDVSNSIVMYLRLLTSAQIRLHPADYQDFIDTQEPMDVVSFCTSSVEPLGKEADNVIIEALCQALKLNVDVAYLNGSKSDQVDFIKIRHDTHDAPPLTLLYRPGHYDVLPRDKM